MNLSIRELRLRYPDMPKPLIEGFELDLAPGQLAILRAPSGSGKTSLLNAISGVIPEHYAANLEGSIYLGSVNLRELKLSDKLSYLSYQMARQHYFFPSLSFELAFPLENLGIEPDIIRQRIDTVARSFGLAGMLERNAADFSEGEAKLLKWAICQMIDAPLVLLDEPCKAMSGRNIELLRAWLRDMKQEGKIVLIAEHSNLLDDMADQMRSPV